MIKKIKIIISVAGIAVLVVAGWLAFSGNGKPKYELVSVKRGDVVQEVSESGQIKKGETVGLSFKAAGRIEKIYVEVGKRISRGERLAKEDDSQLLTRLDEAKAALEVAQAKYDKLLAGSTEEEIAFARAQVESKRVAWESKEQNLSDVRAEGEKDIRQAYEDGLNVLDSALLKTKNAYNQISAIQSAYFYGSDQESEQVKAAEAGVKNKMEEIRTYLDTAKESSLNQDIDAALAAAKAALNSVYEKIALVRDNCEKSFYQNKVSSADKTILDNQKSYVISVRNDVADSQQAIVSAKLEAAADLNAARNALAESRAALKEAEENLAKITAEPSPEDVALRKAEVDQAKSKLASLEDQLRETVIRSPVNGQVVSLEKREGETVSAGETVIKVLPAVPFQVKVDIYEEDIGKIKIGDPVEISLVSFPGQKAAGRVSRVNPAEKIVEGVVYYEIAVDFNEKAAGLKPGMTADVVIRTAERRDVLVLPQEALIKKNGRILVRILKNKGFLEKEIEVGLEGGGLAEIVAGLAEGDQVILP